MNLIKHEIPESQLVWIQANRQKKIHELEYADFNNGMEAILAKAQASLGYAIDSKIKQFIKQELSTNLKRNNLYRRLTLDEVGIFIQNGILGYYVLPKGTLNALNLANIMRWIDMGVQDESRKIALAENAKAETEHITRERTPEEIDALMKLGLASCIEYVMKNKTNTFKAPFKHVYDYLVSKYGIEVNRGGIAKKTLIPDDNEAKELTKIARAKFEADKQRVKKSGSMTDPENLFGWEQRLEMYCKEEYCKRFIEKAVKEGRPL